VAEILVPLFFLALLCLPRYLITDITNPARLYDPRPLSDLSWSSHLPTGGAYKLFFAPNGSADAVQVAEMAAKQLLCQKPSFMRTVAVASSFTVDVAALVGQGKAQQCLTNVALCAQYVVSRPGGLPITSRIISGDLNSFCAPACLANAACYKPWLNEFMTGFPSEQAAVAAATQPGASETVAAVVALPPSVRGDTLQYTIRTNASDVPGTGQFGSAWASVPVAQWVVGPINDWTNYWAFLNYQRAFDGALVALNTQRDPVKAGLLKLSGVSDVILDSAIKAFPYIAYSTNLGGSFAALFFGLIFTFSFLVSVVIMLKSLVMEKELRIREAMQMSGLRNRTYWASWFATHYLPLAVVATLMALIGTYPFKHSSGVLMWAFYLVWCFQLVCFTYALSCTFSTSKIAAIAGSLVYILTWAPAVGVVSGKGSLGNSGWSAVCIFPASSIYMFGFAVALLENAELGVTSHSFFDNLISDTAGSGTFSAGGVLLITLGSALFYALLAVYLDMVWPTQYGTTQPWWFPLSCSFWRSLFARQSDAGTPPSPASDGDVARDALIDGACEAPPVGPAATVSLRQLTKEFPAADGGGTITAVDGLSLDFHRGHISSLLGHNGAGKSTTCAVLCGLLPASGGSAWVDGFSVATNMADIRTRLGVCPQHDVLWPQLSCAEHLELYAVFRGVSRAKAPALARDMLASVGLGDKAQAASSTLSGGQKRKLSLAIAFVGGPSVVLLDEPTTGMDPWSRRSAWDFIRAQKPGRTVVLTTHFLEEADLLSDRIGIMTRGRLACLGSPVFLKSRLGLGYHLTLLLQAGDVEQVCDCVTAHVPDAVCESHVGAELSFLLPQHSVAALPALLAVLDQQGHRYGLNCSTLEEVFLSIAENSTALVQQVGDRVAADTLRDISLDRKRAAGDLRRVAPTGSTDNDGALPTAARPLRTGCRVVAQQFAAVIRKRALNAKRDRLGWCTQYLLPLIFLALGLGLCHIGGGDTTFPAAVMGTSFLGNKPMAGASAPTATALGPDVFAPGTMAWDTNVSSVWSCDGPIAMNGAAAPASSESLSALAASLGVTTRPLFCQPSTTDCAALGCTPPGAATLATLDSYLLAGTSAHKNCIQEGTSSPCGAVFVKAASVRNRSFSFVLETSPTAYHVLPAAQSVANSAVYSALLGRAASIQVVNHPLPATTPPSAGQGLILNMLAGLCVVLALGSLSASAAVFLVAEKRARSRHLALVSGVRRSTFWAATLTWDLLNFCIPLALFTAAFAASDVTAYTQGGALGVIFVMLLLFGLAAIPLAYLLHFPFGDEMNALAGQMGVYFFFGVGQLIAAVVLVGLSALGKARGTWAALQVLFRWLPHYNVGIVLFKLSQNQAAQPMESPWARDISGTEMRVLAAEAAVFMALTLCIDYDVFASAERCVLWLWSHIASDAPPNANGSEDYTSEEDDEDVSDERHRIQNAGGDAGDLLTVQGLRKTYRGGKAAVRGITLGIAEGRCLGLLGLNGAGKSTLFRLLTGELTPTAGDALIRGNSGSAAGETPHSVNGQLDLVRQRMGLCPQEDAVCDRLTCREHLLFYAAVRGQDAVTAGAMADSLLTRMGLSNWRNALAGQLSGGNKRKLGACVALVGAPPLALYDEPSSGMDPEARRALWNVLAGTMAGRATMLTTHVLAEAEALCQDIAIMVDGRLVCFGSAAHLKSTHGSGYTIEVRCAPHHAGRVATAIAAVLPAARLQEEQAGRLTYALPVGSSDDSHTTGLSVAFAALEQLQLATPSVGVQDFSVTQSSLEQIFIGFASQRGVMRKAANGRLPERKNAVRLHTAINVDATTRAPGEMGVQCPACNAALQWREGVSVMRCGACDALCGLPTD